MRMRADNRLVLLCGSTDNNSMGKTTTQPIAVIGGGPAGLIAAETLSRARHPVVVFERMPTPGRKFQMAGRGGLNLTHSEPMERFLSRYGTARGFLSPAIGAFSPSDLRDWADGLGQETFIGSSGRVFPKAMKAAPLLRAWLSRLQAQGVELRYRMTWEGWDADGRIVCRNADGEYESMDVGATVLALGGGSWPKLGSDAAWTDILAQQGVEIVPVRPSNCGFVVEWSDVFRDRFQGTPLKNIALRCAGQSVRGDAVVTAYGIEGGAVYALSSALRTEIETQGHATLIIDFAPDRTADDLRTRLQKPRGKRSLSDHLRRTLGLSPVAINLMREQVGRALPDDPAALAHLVQGTSVKLIATAPVERAISTAGGVSLAEVDDAYMLKKCPGVFVAGEMLDWEAPTGGYLLQGAFASGIAAAKGALAWLETVGRDR